MNTSASNPLPRLQRHRRWLDVGTRSVVGMGGVSVIAAILLIFFYLVWVVAPVFSGASVSQDSPLALAAAPLYLGADDNSEFAIAITSSGELRFLPLDDEGEARRIQLPVRGEITAVIPASSAGDRLGLVIDNQALLLINLVYPVSFADDQRLVRPDVVLTHGEEPITLDQFSAPLQALDLVMADTTLLVAGLDTAGSWGLLGFEDAEPGYPLLPPDIEVMLPAPPGAQQLFFGESGNRVMLVAANGTYTLVDTSWPADPVTLLSQPLLEPGQQLTAAAPLLGGMSVMIADATGVLRQWFPVRDPKGSWRMVTPRQFELPAAVIRILPERRRKGLLAVTADGTAHLLHTTAERNLGEFGQGLNTSVLGYSPKADLLLAAAADGRVSRYHIDNEHPEISWSAMWDKVWYEGYREPVYSWQSSSADNDFEPKFSLTPLAFGTLKAAFYAMLFALPLAITGAIYTAYFMAPSMRNWIKPGIEIMAALPTVILGFIGGLWLAPLIEEQLASVLALLVCLPAGLLLFAWLWRLLPGSLVNRLGDGWEAAIAVLPIIGITWLVFASGGVLEEGLFAGSTQEWIRVNLGLDYDQRNSLVVGIAMGLAVIPTIFSISEDAIYSVPKHLTNGSLALGATRWQTLTRVVLLTASPGIFSAVMIGLGRAVGETMIVLMATGNTPVMDFSIFQGMRTFAANIAVELPESEVASTHYRILFLAALVLFAITFVFNTAAELIRQRLRERYGNL